MSSRGPPPGMPMPARPPGIPQQPAPAGNPGLPGSVSHSPQMPQVRMPLGPPSAWKSGGPPPPPQHAPPPVATGLAPQGLEDVLANDAVMAAVRERVMPMLAAATRASELQVKTEIQKLEGGFASLTAKAGRVQALLQERVAQQDTLCHTLFEVERRWDREIQDVKRELHQTILAHNHNADVMADHKTAIDKICTEVEEVGHLQFQSDAEHRFQEQLHRLARTLEDTKARDQEVDALLQRGEALSQRLGAMGTAHSAAVGVALPSRACGQRPPFHASFPHAFA